MKTLEEHLRRAFPTQSTSLIPQLTPIQRTTIAPFVRVADIQRAAEGQKEDELMTLVGRVVYSSKRGGLLMLDDESGSIPFAIESDGRDPQLLDSLVIVQRFYLVDIIKWDDHILVVDEEWRDYPSESGEENELGLSSPPRKRAMTSRPTTFYVEAKSWQVALPRQSATKVKRAMSSSITGVVSAMSPIIAASSSLSERYWMIELTSGKLIVAFGKQNEGFRLLLRIGQQYSFFGLKLSELRFGQSAPMWVYVCAQDVLLDCEHNDPTNLARSKPANEPNGTCDKYQVNLFSYQGYVTGRPAGQVVELDHKYKVVLNRVSKGMWLGLRKGALVLFRSVCQLNWRGVMVGFEGTLRTDLEIIEFSQERRQPQRRFPVDEYPLLRGAAYIHALSFISRFHRFCRGLVSSLDDGELFRKGKDEAECADGDTSSDFGEKIRRGMHPIAAFLNDWEVPFALPVQFPLLISLEDVVSTAIKECAASRSTLHVKQFSLGEVFLVCELRTSTITGQLCLLGGGAHIEDERPCIECVVALKLEHDWRAYMGKLVRADEFDVVVERASPPQTDTAVPSVESIRRCLRYCWPRDSKGRCLWHGHVSDEDVLGLTRVFVLIKTLSPWEATTTNPSVPSAVTSQAPRMPSAIFFDFAAENGTCSFSSVITEEQQRRVVRSGEFPPQFGAMNYFLPKDLILSREESVAHLVRTRQMPSRLFFVVTQIQVVQARKFDVTFEKERRLKKQQKGVQTSSLLYSWAFKLTVRDVQSPMRMDIFVSLEDRVIPPLLLSAPADQIWMLTGGSVMGEHKIYLQADAKSNLCPVWIQGSNKLVADYPRDLGLLPLGQLSDLRRSKSHCGSCVLLVVVQVAWARYSFLCPRSCPSGLCLCPLKDELLKLQVMIEADDGTDQCQLFAEGHTALALLDIPRNKLKEFCGLSARRLGRIEYKLNAECEPTSPQGLLRHFLLNGTSAGIPRRAYVVKDRPLGAHSNNNSNDQQGFHFDEAYASRIAAVQQPLPVDGEELVEDFSRFAYVRTWQDVRVKTCLRPRLTVNLLEIDPAPRDEEEMTRLLLGGDGSA